MAGVKWLQQASEVVSAPCSSKRCNLSDAEEVLASSQVLFFPLFVSLPSVRFFKLL